MDLSRADLENMFANAEMDDSRARRLREMRETFVDFAEVINNELENSRAKELALEYLQTCAMWVTKGITRETVGFENDPEGKTEVTERKTTTKAAKAAKKAVSKKAPR